jgi:hypothetical protein
MEVGSAGRCLTIELAASARAFLTILLFVATIVEVGSGTDQRRNQKSSPLPLIFYRLVKDILEPQPKPPE